MIKWDGHRGARPGRRLEIEKTGDAVSRPYVPPGTKKKGEGGEGELFVTDILRLHSSLSIVIIGCFDHLTQI